MTTRREWLRLVGASASALVIGCGDNLAGNDAAAAVFEPTASGFLVSVWARTARTVTIAIAEGAIARMHEMQLGESGTGVLEVEGLAASSAYDVVVLVEGARLSPHRARTAPADDDTRPVRLAIAADVDPNPEFDSDLADHVVAAAPELLVTLGDFPYTDNGPPAMTVAEYRERHVDTRTHSRVRTLLEAMPVRAIYDDHEFRNNWDGARAAAEPSRYAAAMQTWDEFFPLREPGEVKYRKFRWGANVECFLLDCRRFRSPETMGDSSAKTMLGTAQKQWFLDGIAASTATFKLVFTSVPLDFAEPDCWTGYLNERAQLFDAVIGIPGVLFVSADQHYFGAFRHPFGIREFQVGPLCRGLGVFGTDGSHVLFRAQRFNVGLVDIRSDSLTFTGLGAGGERFYEETLTADQLTPRRT